jgi:hypothetical protein
MDRLFNDKHGLLLRQAGEQVLGALIDEVPAQVRKNEEREQ